MLAENLHPDSLTPCGRCGSHSVPTTSFCWGFVGREGKAHPCRLPSQPVKCSTPQTASVTSVPTSQKHAATGQKRTARSLSSLCLPSLQKLYTVLDQDLGSQCRYQYKALQGLTRIFFIPTLTGQMWTVRISTDM